MKKAVALLISACGLLLTEAVQAQSAYTDYLTAQKAGEGRVVIVQDATIADLVNNVTVRTAAAAAPKPVTARDTASTRTRTTPRASYTGERRQRHYVQGYRIQIFTGGNSREDKAAAQRAGEKCRKAFGELSVYPHFVSPRWICQVGDFRNMNDAKKYLSLIRSARISNEARIVSCKVLAVY